MPKLITTLRLYPVYNDNREVSTEIYFPSIPDKMMIARERQGKEDKQTILYYGEPAEVFIWLNMYLCLNREETRIDSNGLFYWENYFTSGKYKTAFTEGPGCGVPEIKDKA